MPRFKEFHNGTHGYYVNHFTLLSTQSRGSVGEVWHSDILLPQNIGKFQFILVIIGFGLDCL